MYTFHESRYTLPQLSSQWELGRCTYQIAGCLFFVSSDVDESRVGNELQKKEREQRGSADNGVVARRELGEDRYRDKSN